MDNIYPEPTVGAVIINAKNEVLLCQSSKWNNQYVIPGGHIEKGETMEEALRREVMEETGLEVYDIKLISLQESVFSPHFHEKRHFIFIDFLCRTNSTNVVLNDEADSYVWAPLDQVLGYDLGGFIREFFEAYLSENQISTNMLYGYAKHS